MIVYFADRRLSILGLASTELDSVAYISDDKMVTDVDTGTTTLSLVIEYDDAGRKRAESMANAGNYILRNRDGKDEFYTIIDYEEDVDGHNISIYAEDGGLDLINDVAGPFYAETPHTMQWYMERWLQSTGFEVRPQGLLDLNRELQLGWDSTTTVTNRLISIAAAFESEIDFGFDIEGLELIHKYVNVYKKRGKDVKSKLRVGKELSNLRIKKSVANLATALDAVGGRDELEVDMYGVGAILIGNDFAFGDGNGGWIDSFYNQTECMGYAIRQPGGDFAAKGNSSSTYPGKNYAECLASFMSTSGSQNKTCTVDGDRQYKLVLDLSWAIPTNDNPISVSYNFRLVAGSYYFTNFYIGYNVTIGGVQLANQARSASSYISISQYGTYNICSGTGTIPQSDGNISISASIDMNPYTADGRAVGPSPMKINDSFKVVKANTDEEKRTIRYIIVGGGINDISTTKNSGGINAIKSGIDSFINVAHTNFPYAKIYFIPLMGTIEGNIADQSKEVKCIVSRTNFNESQWLTYTTLGHTETWGSTSGMRNGAKTDDIFHVRGKSTDGGWTHTAVYRCTNDSGDLAGVCVGHIVDDIDVLKESWAGYARTKGVYTCEKATDWFRAYEEYRPESGSSMLLTSSGYNEAGRLIEKYIGGWDGDIDSADNGYMNARYITLEGLDYDDGDFYVDGTLLKSRTAVSKWTRFANNETAYTNSYHIVKSFSYDTNNKDELLTRSIAELKRLREAEVTYEADVVYLPKDVSIGDVVDIVDEFGEIFLSTRILQIEHSDVREEDRIVFGEFSEKPSGISQLVYELADRFREEASKQSFNTWTVYADDNQGQNMSLTRLPSSKYLGIATYRISPDVDMSDPGIFKWTVLDDSDSITISISSSNGTYFTTTTVNTVLTAYVFVNGVMQTADQIAQYGFIHWYKDGSLIMEPGTSRPYEGQTLAILESELVDKGVYEARLEG